MPISFTCECGKKMAAKDEFAGNRVRCPECQRLIAIPAVRAAAPKALTSPQVKPVAKATPTVRPVKSAPLHETQAPSNTIPVPPAARTNVPIAAPISKTTPRAKPIAAPKRSSHPWFDTSLTQTATPWLPGDEARYQAGVKPAREWTFPLVPALSLAAVVGFFVMALTSP